jgi:hypothetical protein
VGHCHENFDADDKWGNCLNRRHFHILFRHNYVEVYSNRLTFLLNVQFVTGVVDTVGAPLLFSKKIKMML